MAGGELLERLEKRGPHDSEVEGLPLPGVAVWEVSLRELGLGDLGRWVRFFSLHGSSLEAPDEVLGQRTQR